MRSTAKALLATVLAAMTGAALAMPPVTVFEGMLSDEGELTLLNGDPACPDFTVHFTVEWYEVDKLYFDNDGNETELRGWFREGTEAYWTDLGATLEGTDTWAGNFVLPIDGDTIALHGIGFHVNVPGVGNVLMNTGITVLTLYPFEPVIIHGNQSFNEGDLDAFCAALRAQL